MARRDSRSSGRARGRGARAPAPAEAKLTVRAPLREALARWRNTPWPLVAAFVALELFAIAIGLPPWLNDYHRSQGRRLAKEGRYEEAIPHYEYLRRKYQESPTVNLELGLAYLNAGQYEKAVERLVSVTSGPEPPPGVHSKIGEAYVGLGQHDRALMEFNAAQEENPKDPVACYYLGEQLFQNGKLLEAARLLERAAFHSRLGPSAQERLKEIERRIFEGPPASAPTPRK